MLPKLITQYNPEVDGNEIYAECIAHGEWLWVRRNLYGQWRAHGYSFLAHPIHYFSERMVRDSYYEGIEIPNIPNNLSSSIIGESY